MEVLQSKSLLGMISWLSFYGCIGLNSKCLQKRTLSRSCGEKSRAKEWAIVGSHERYCVLPYTWKASSWRAAVQCMLQLCDITIDWVCNNYGFLHTKMCIVLITTKTGIANMIGRWSKLTNNGWWHMPIIPHSGG
jgi:hypothetical protein